ncbi:hypothetical protein VPNG_09253 [Cytospora leucostoma]|uniref:Uncharacterized protein n=1 Tax=Cytospora leucostoma TaxID=1230097 RepID=A0A423W0T2_9PEZI|nr:hypothetical protein VPNG_09253 [Cytospora leucostoma]
MYESQALEFIRHTRNQQVPSEARQAALAVKAQEDEPMAMVTDEFHLFGGAGPMQGRNPWVAKSSAIDGAHDDFVDSLSFAELKALLEQPRVTEDCSDSHVSAGKASEDKELTVQDAQQLEMIDDSDDYSEAEPDQKDDDDYIPPVTRGRKVASTSASVSHLTSVRRVSSSLLHDDQGLVEFIERQGDSHRQLSTAVMEEDKESAADQVIPPGGQGAVRSESSSVALEGDQQPAAGVIIPPEGQSNDRHPSHVEETDNQPQITGQVLEVLQAMATGMARVEARLKVIEDGNRGHDRGT